jgi:hypothetical protein
MRDFDPNQYHWYQWQPRGNNRKYLHSYTSNSPSRQRFTMAAHVQRMLSLRNVRRATNGG